MTAAIAPVLCACSHPARAHGDDGCRVPDCVCSEDATSARCVYPQPVDAVDLKRCTRCGEAKPLTEFYERHKGANDRLPHCRDCDVARPKRTTETKLIRNRARHRAVAALVRRHKDEFANLLERETHAVQWEMDLLRENERSSHAPGGLPRLRPGQRRSGQDVEARIDPNPPCTSCSGYHRHGHVCTECGAEPEREAS